MKINKVDMKNIDKMLKDNINNLTSPMDDMYELGIIPSCDFFEIIDESGVCVFLLLIVKISYYSSMLRIKTEKIFQ